MKTEYIQKTKQLIQDETDAELKSNEIDVKAVVTDIPISFLKTTTFMAIFPTVTSIIPIKILLGFDAFAILIALIFIFLLKNERKNNKERILKHQLDLTKGLETLSESNEYVSIIKDLAKRSYLNYIQKSRKIIEF